MRQLLVHIICIVNCNFCFSQNQITATYNAGHIPSSFSTYDNSCNGPSAVLVVTLPAGDNYAITNVQIKYDIESKNPATKAEQRSYIRYANKDLSTAEQSGIGNRIRHLINIYHTQKLIPQT
jgi:hypothetical protein